MVECPRRGCANVAVMDGAESGALGMSNGGGESASRWAVTSEIEMLQVMPPAIADAMPVQSLEFWGLVEGSAAIGRRMGLRLARGLRPSWIGPTMR